MRACPAWQWAVAVGAAPVQLFLAAASLALLAFAVRRRRGLQSSPVR